jgi:hypothetical protein
MKSHKLILLSLAALIFISCENQLELDPKQNEDASITLNTESGITNILTGTYAIAATGDVYGGRILVAGFIGTNRCNFYHRFKMEEPSQV